MYTDHGTFIIAFKPTKNDLTVSPEVAVITKFVGMIEKVGYAHTDNTFRIGWEQAVSFPLLAAIMDFNIEDKKELMQFWRKALKKRPKEDEEREAFLRLWCCRNLFY